MERLLDKQAFKKWRAIPLGDLMRDERHREETDKKKLDFNLRKSSAEDKLLLAAKMSMQNGITYEQVQEFPHRKSTYHSRLMMPLPMSSVDVWIARSYMEGSAEPFTPRTNFQFDLFGKLYLKLAKMPPHILAHFTN